MTTANTGSRRRSRSWLGLLAALPGGLAGVLPVGVCAACWPAYAGILGSLGLGFLLESRFLIPVTAGALGIALGALAYRARSRRGYSPLGLGAAGSALLLVGKFVLGWTWATNGGIALVIAASIWNSWPRRRAASCPACQVSGTEEASVRTSG
jgi:hypothetical protein